MKKQFIKLALFILLSGFGYSATAQQVNTLYFMDNIAERQALNPGFIPNTNYFNIPVLPDFRMEIGNNSLKFEDIIFSQRINGIDSTITFMHPQANRTDFYNKLHKTTRINADMTFNILGLGFKGKNGKNYYSFNACQKFENGMYLPKDMFKMALYGTDTINQTKYDFNKFGIKSQAYTEIAFGFSRQQNEKFTWGFNVKYLMGQYNISTDMNELAIEAGLDKWAINGEGTLNMSVPAMDIPVDVNNKLDFNNITFEDTFTASEIRSMALTGNWGLGLDLGATYKVIPDLELSLGLTDLGFIRWRNNVTNASLNGGYEFTGIQYGLNDDMNAKMDSLQSAFKDAFNTSGTKKAYTTGLSTRLNVGAEYSVSQDRIGFGVLSSTLFVNKSAFSDITTSVNFRPFHWFSSSFSYSLLSGNYSSFGFGAQLRLLAFNMYAMVDRVPLNVVKVDGIPLPNKLKSANIQVGWVWAFGVTDKDDDKDGVRNKRDKCPNTPFGDIIDKVGCTLDSDKDGVADNKDKCPDTPLGTPVDSVGCTLDDDKDGVINPSDKCPDTPAGVKVDADGCPLDTDGDGVADFKDKCPDTPAEARGTVDENGCPKDTDGDSVFDYKDKCPGTPAEAYSTVDEYGCPKDSDGDVVPDYRDKCPATPIEARPTIDANGCPKDTDGDGVADYQDNCPTAPGPISNKGCPEVKAEVKKLFQQALQGIQFETNKAVIKPVSFAILDKIVKVMKDNPDYFLQIYGHTDNVGDDAKNQTLSDNRANAVMKYLTDRGIDASRMTAQGFGELMPVDTNTTPAGRAKNRRVEFTVKFERFEKAE